MGDLPAWANESVELHPPDPAWLKAGQRQRSELEAWLAPWLVAPVEHVGSTSVPGLAAKPILDLQAAVADLEAAGQAVAVILAPHGWHYVPPELDQRPYRRFFVQVVDDHRAAHLHLMTPDTIRWHEQLAFRDALRARPDLVRAYARLKTGLAEQHRDDRETYSAGKQQFIEDVLTHHQDARPWRFRVSVASAPGASCPGRVAGGR